MSKKRENKNITHKRAYTSRGRVTCFMLLRSRGIRGFGVRVVTVGERNLAVEFHVRFWAWTVQVHSYKRFGGLPPQEHTPIAEPALRRRNCERWK